MRVFQIVFWEELAPLVKANWAKMKPLKDKEKILPNSSMTGPDHAINSKG